MEGTYQVYEGDNHCGKLQIRKQGLYYTLFCRCRISSTQICRLRACFPDGEINLGVLTPVEDGFGFFTRIPVKRFLDGPVRFVVVPVHGLAHGLYVPIKPEEPFSYIEKIKDAYLIKKEHSMGAWIK